MIPNHTPVATCRLVAVLMMQSARLSLINADISQRNPPLLLHEKTGSVRARTPAATIRTMAGTITTLADSIAPLNPATFNAPPPIITPSPIALFSTAVWIAVAGTV